MQILKNENSKAKWYSWWNERHG